MENLFLGVILGGINALIVVVLSQLVVWGLAQEHIYSDLGGPFLLICAAEGVIAAGVHLGSRLGQ